MSGRTSLKNILLWSRWLGVNPSSVDTDPTRNPEHILFSNSETSLSAGFVTTFKTVILVKLSVATVNSTDTVSHRFRTSEHPGPVHPGVCLKTHTDMAFSILEQKRTKPGISWIGQYKSTTTTLFIVFTVYRGEVWPSKADRYLPQNFPTRILPFPGLERLKQEYKIKYKNSHYTIFDCI